MNQTVEATSDLSSALAKLLESNRELSTIIVQPPVTGVAPGDGMYSGNDAYYLQTGLSALKLVLHSWRAADRGSIRPAFVLDYACGFGRVTRWLQAAFPDAELHAADLDAKATAAVTSLMQVSATHIRKDLSQPLQHQYDLIWVGSLLTHLCENDSGAALRFLKEHLTDQGILIATTHGSYVANRLRRRNKTYNLNDDAIDPLVTRYDECGSAFAPYPGQSDYGISIIHPQRMVPIAQACGLDLLYFEQRGWVKHQDCFAFIRSESR